ncbi:MAG: hypothetical protein RJA70_247 [Pseudomonadota bacterium]|jgi:hypothetical protein
MPIAGGTPVALASSQDFVTTIAVDATSVYWSAWLGLGDDNYGLFRKSKSGGAPTRLPGAYWQLNALVAATDGLYVLESGDPSGATGRVLKFPTSGGSPVVLASGQRQPLALALDENYAYFTCAPAAGSGLPKTAMMVPRSGGTPITLATLEPAAVTHPVQFVALNDSGIYFNDARQSPDTGEYFLWRLPR